MGTVVTVQVQPQATPAGDVPGGDERAIDEAIDRAFGWFLEVESACTRFDDRSELRQLLDVVGRPVPVGALLFEALRFALAVAEASGGAFDPTVGHAMEARGFDREHRTGRRIRTAMTPAGGDGPTFRDVRVDANARAVTLARPVLLDLGAVAKGLAVDMAARELAPLCDFAIDAGGDLYLGGRNPAGDLWSVGIRHPRAAGRTIATVRVSDRAVCTSGDYERQDDEGGGHILDPRRRVPATSLASATVIAPSAMAADALATAAFVLGPDAGLRFLEAQGVDGLLVSDDLTRRQTPGFPAGDPT
ncbi:MAG: FAD:protein FMN transferase [Vicinamibacterales bacterium]